MSTFYLLLLVCVVLVAANASTCVDDLDCLDKQTVCVHGVCMYHNSSRARLLAAYRPVECNSSRECPGNNVCIAHYCTRSKLYRNCYPVCDVNEFCDHRVGFCRIKDPLSLYY